MLLLLFLPCLALSMVLHHYFREGRDKFFTNEAVPSPPWRQLDVYNAISFLIHISHKVTFHFKPAPQTIPVSAMHFHGAAADTTEEATVNSETRLAATYESIHGGNLLMRFNSEQVEKNKKRNLPTSCKGLYVHVCSQEHKSQALIYTVADLPFKLKPAQSFGEKVTLTRSSPASLDKAPIMEEIGLCFPISTDFLAFQAAKRRYQRDSYFPISGARKNLFGVTHRR